MLATHVSKKVSLMPSSHLWSIWPMTFLMLAVRAVRGSPPSTPSTDSSGCREGQAVREMPGRKLDHRK